MTVDELLAKWEVEHVDIRTGIYVGKERVCKKLYRFLGDKGMYHLIPAEERHELRMMARMLVMREGDLDTVEMLHSAGFLNGEEGKELPNYLPEGQNEIVSTFEDEKPSSGSCYDPDERRDADGKTIN
jgi:hypothetical protein